ncbi:PspA/IM30 family protein [Microscilla marina]|uniref:Phage shock protein A, PspA n=1 Tax=Microscilla marina ATCC 23134 TaxID=313606 RepID=A1ZU27_MICM2|nr:PspA/IM30 family protein [Microscilla marina]EAY26140.1 phage shock protein A, PspA [Microscilla marina ATCC 23134]
MSIFKRIADIIRAYINDLFDKAEDPEKMIKQMVIEMEEGVAKSTTALAKALASEKQLERKYKGLANKAQNWERKAMVALQSGNENLARQALMQKATLATQANEYQKMLKNASAATKSLRNQVDALKSKLKEARMKESTLLARNQMAKTQKKLAKQLGGFDMDNNFARFDKFEERILKAEAEAEAMVELADESGGLDDEFKALEQSSSINEDLAQLRAKMNMG